MADMGRAGQRGSGLLKVRNVAASEGQLLARRADLDCSGPEYRRRRNGTCVGHVRKSSEWLCLKAPTLLLPKHRNFRQQSLPEAGRQFSFRRCGDDVRGQKREGQRQLD